METYTEKEIELALDTLSVVFENDEEYNKLSDTAKELFACALLGAHKLTRSK